MRDIQKYILSYNIRPIMLNIGWTEFIRQSSLTTHTIKKDLVFDDI